MRVSVRACECACVCMCASEGRGEGYECVGLAGSERAKKTGVARQRFKEVVVVVGADMSACTSECV